MKKKTLKLIAPILAIATIGLPIQQAAHVTHAHDLSVDTIHVENYQADAVSEAPVFSNEAKAVRYVRDQLKQRSESITLNYAFSSDEYDKVSSLVNSIINKAEEYTGIDDEGDYIVYNIYSWNMKGNIVYQENNYDGKYIYTITYLKADGDTAAAEEAAVTNKVNEVYKSLQLDGKSSYDKLKAIHDYIIDHVEYDYDNYKNDAYLVKHATYSAAITGKTVCQGYAKYFYRLANKAGIECRVVDGTANGGRHAWNLVKIDGKYYYVDVTWDDGNYDKYTYFLKESDLFAQDHTLSDESQKNFGDYNISKTDYDAKLIPTHTHNYVTTTKREPTCIDEGLSVKTCTICQDEQMIILPKTTHQWTLHSTVAATEDKDGSKTYTCSVCGETKTEVIPKLPKATWMKNQNGWWYQNIDGTYPRKQWMKIDNIWYYFDVDGYMVTNWQKINNKWYFFDDKGAMVTGWKKSGNKWYYLDGQGAMVSDKWQKIDGKWYVFDKSGAMKSNAWVGNYYVGSDGAYVKDRWIGKYHVNKNGVWDKTAGWQKLGGSCYYLGQDGTMKTGWQKLGGSCYYLGQDGTMKTGWQYISDKCYYFYDSGKMASSTWLNNKYYLKADGSMAVNEYINGYWLDENGVWSY